MKAIVKSLKKHWDQSSAHVRPCMKIATKTVVNTWIASFIVSFFVLWIEEGNLHFLSDEEVRLGLFKFTLMLTMVSGLMLTAMRIGLTSLLVLWFWLSTLTTFAPTAQAAPQFSFAYANAANCEQHWEPITPTTRFEFSKTAPTDTYTPTIPAKPGETCYEATIDGKKYLIINLSLSVQNSNYTIEAEQQIKDLIKYTIARAPFKEEGLQGILHNIAHLYDCKFQQHTQRQDKRFKKTTST